MPGAVLGLSDPAQRSTGTWHLARAAAHPDGHKRDLGVVTARTFLKGLPRLWLLGFQVGVGGGVGRCGKDRGQGTLWSQMPEGLALLGSGRRVPSAWPPCAPSTSRAF